MDLQGIVDAASARYPESLAIQHKARQISYAELPEALASLAGKVGYLGGARVAVVLKDSATSCLLYLHLLQARATAIPVPAQVASPYLGRILERVRPHYVVTNRILSKRHAEVLRGYHCVLVDNPAGGDPEFTLQEKRGEAGARAGRADPAAREPDDIRVIMFTSGSTGRPKGVCLSESNLLAAAGMMAEFLRLGPERRTLVTLPMYDYYGYIQILGHLLRGGGCVFGESTAFLGSLIKAIEAEAVTDLAIVPHSLRQILDLAEERFESALRGLRCVTSSSDVLTQDLLKRAFRLNPNLLVYNIYGLTEAGRACYREIRAETPFSHSIGRPSPGVEILVDGSKQEPGDIIIKGPNVARGYLREVVDDRLDLIPCESVTSGDLGYFDDNGEIVLVGRKDHVINAMGEKIHPSEIESLAMEVPGVNDALARPVTDANGRVSVHLDVVCTELDACKPQLEGLLRGHLSRTFFPTEIRSVPGIERTDLGSKLKRSGAS